MNLPKIIANARNKAGSASKARTSQAKDLSSASSPNAPVAFDAAVLYLLCRLGSWPGLSAEEKAEGCILPCVAYPASDLVLAAQG